MNGKTYLMPMWQEVVNGTTVNDINWIKPKVKTEKKEVIKHKFLSSKGDKEYITKEIKTNEGTTYTCNCPGYYRAKDRKCKHIKSLLQKS